MVRNILLGVGGVLLALVLIVVLLILAPEWLRVALRDIAIIFMVLLGIIATLLQVALVVALIFVAFLIRDKIVPLLEQLTQTVGRVRGTTEFVSDEVVQPIIQAAGTVARVRAMARTALRREKE
jgi:uncharacterized membrane protein